MLRRLSRSVILHHLGGSQISVVNTKSVHGDVGEIGIESIGARNVTHLRIESSPTVLTLPAAVAKFSIHTNGDAAIDDVLNAIVYIRVSFPS